MASPNILASLIVRFMHSALSNWPVLLSNMSRRPFRFQAALKKYGVPDEEIFQTADLYERRNIPQVTLCLYALSRLVCCNR